MAIGASKIAIIIRQAMNGLEPNHLNTPLFDAELFSDYERASGIEHRICWHEIVGFHVKYGHEHKKQDVAEA